MTKKKTKYMERADTLFSKIIRDRDGCCLNCGSTAYLQCAHIHSRSYKSIRCDFDNAVTLCRSCHKKFTHWPLEWQAWVEERYPGRWDRLMKQALRYERVDWKQRYDELREVAKNLELV